MGEVMREVTGQMMSQMWGGSPDPRATPGRAKVSRQDSK